MKANLEDIVIKGPLKESIELQVIKEKKNDIPRTLKNFTFKIIFSFSQVRVLRIYQTSSSL